MLDTHQLAALFCGVGHVVLCSPREHECRYVRIRGDTSNQRISSVYNQLDRFLNWLTYPDESRCYTKTVSKSVSKVWSSQLYSLLLAVFRMRPSFYLDKPKRQSSSIMLNVAIGGKRIRFGTGVIIEPKHWNSEKGSVRSTDPHRNANTKTLDRPAPQKYYQQK